MGENSIFLIDIDKVLRDKAGKKANRIPRFLVSYLKHIVHQDEINVFLKSVADKTGVDFLEACMEFLDIKLEVKGIENLPSDGLCTFVSNHPLGGQDGIALGYILGKHYNGRIKYLVNDLQMVEAGFRSDSHIIMFPAGICSRRQKGVIKDLAWKKTFISKSVETQRDVIPVHFEGRNSDFFYNLANLCKFLGIKFNIAMLYLADEMFKNRHKTFKVTIGKPIPWQTFDKSRSATEWADYVRELVYKL